MRRSALRLGLVGLLTCLAVALGVMTLTAARAAAEGAPPEGAAAGGEVGTAQQIDLAVAREAAAQLGAAASFVGEGFTGDGRMVAARALDLGPSEVRLWLHRDHGFAVVEVYESIRGPSGFCGVDTRDGRVTLLTPRYKTGLEKLVAPLSTEAALAVAKSFLRRHGLLLPPEARLEIRGTVKYGGNLVGFLWWYYSGEVRLEDTVAVDLDVATGLVKCFDHFAPPLTVSLQPGIGAAEAVKAARSYCAENHYRADGAVEPQAELQVMHLPYRPAGYEEPDPVVGEGPAPLQKTTLAFQRQYLVWTVTVFFELTEARRDRYERRPVLWVHVDAQTGKVLDKMSIPGTRKYTPPPGPAQ